MANYREPQWLLPNEKNLQYPSAGATQGSGLSADRHSLYSMDFDGASRIDLDDTNDSFEFTNTPFSVSIWVKGSSALNRGIICCSSRSVTYGWQIQATSANKVSFSAAQATNARTATSTTSLSDDEWIHVVGIFKPDAPANEHVEIWVNGIREGIAGWLNPPTLSYQTTPYKRIAFGYNANTGRRYVGQIDEVAIFSRALSSSEISTLYNNGAPSNPMLLSGKPLAYYPLGEQARNPNSSNWRFPNEVLQGQAIDFDGSNDYIDIGQQDELKNITALSISLWFNYDSIATSADGLVGRDSSTRVNGNWYVALDSNNSIRFLLKTANGQDALNSSTISANKWYHTLCVWNGTTMKIYLNGDLSNSITLSNATGTLGSVSDIVAIGRRFDSSGFLNGSASNVAIWNSDQSANIANIYNYGAPQTSYTVTPTAWYKLDKTSKFTGLNPNWHSALDLEGTSKYVSTGLTTTAGAKSLSYWFKCSTASGYQAMFGSTNGISDTTNSYLGDSSSYWSDESISFFTPTGGSGSTSQHIAIRNGHTAYQDGNWHHSVLVYTGSTKYWYIDGVSQTIDYRATYNTDPSLDINIANLGIGFAYGATLSGNLQMSNFAYFDQAISAEDVKYLYNGGTPQTNISFEPVSWWKLDNTTTGIQDSGSASNNGTNNGATEVASNVAVDEWVFENTVQSQTPNWSSALEFKPIDSDYIRIPDNDSLSFGNGTTDQPFSLSIWANLNDVTSAFLFAKRGGSNNREYQFNFASNNKLYFTLYSQLSGNYISRRVDTDLSSYENQWIHLVATYDGSSTVSGIKIYINGSQEVTETGSLGTYIAMSNGQNDLILGRFSSDYLDGELSNAQIYNVELSSSQVETLYNSGQPESTASLSPMSWWKLDNTTTGIQDSVGSNNGTNNGATEIQTNVWTPRLNGDSDTLPSDALVSSDLQFNSAYSSFSLDFDGTDYVNCTDNDMFSFGNGATDSPFSISTWINMSTVTNFVPIAKDSSGAREWTIRMVSGQIHFYIIDNSVTNGYLGRRNSSTPATNTWFNLICTYDGSKSSSGIKIYLDGTRVDDTDYNGAGTYVAMENTSAIVSIGMQQNGTVSQPGKIDETAIWNRALNQAEITSIYNNGYPKDLTALSPISWWRLGEDTYFNGNDFIIPNQITGAPNGTSNGMPATALVADAPGSYAAGLGSSLVEADRVGDAPNSTANSLSFNMTPENRISYPAGYVPTQADNVYSMDFDGANDHILTTLDITSFTSFSISAWVYANSLGGYNGVASQYRAGNPSGSSSWFLETISSDMAFGIANGAGAPIYATKAFSTSTWHHVVGVWDGSQVEVYIDGVASGSPQSITAMNTATVNMAIGGIWNNGGTLVDNGMWNGKIDEVAIFDYALSARQIKQDIYNGTTSGKTADLNNISNLTPPVAWYRMGD